jgi:tRNA (cytidine/uridine-2'-O-)-methyltransferase
MKVILCNPQIPSNTGNIARTCVLTSSDLVLVKPLGFSLADRHLKRAGLDYWQELSLEVIEDLPTYLESQASSFYFFSSKASPSYAAIDYKPSDLLIFGSETTGLDALFWQRWPERFVTIPQKKGPRCLNLSNSVAIALYEALRQQAFTFPK